MKLKRILSVLIFVFVVSSQFVFASSYDHDLVRYIARQKNKIPKKYTAPTTEQIGIFRNAVYCMLNGGFSWATQSANAIGYNLKSITHTNGITYYILESKDPHRRPWGTYVFYLGTNNQNYVIEVPHPVEEKNSSIIGIKAFITDTSYTSHGNINAFFMSGSKKRAGDVTLLEDSFFLAAHKEITDIRHSTALQIHGFSKRSYPQIVLTSGSPVAIAEMDDFIEEFVQDNFEVGVFDGIQYTNCGATENMQAIYNNSYAGVPFIAFYLNRPAHTSKTKSRLFEQSMKEVTVSETFAIE